MFIRIEDMKLLKVEDRTIKKILEKKKVDPTVIRNLMRGFFTPTNYSEPRFDQKVENVKNAMEDLSEKSDKYFFFENKHFLFPKTELDAVIRDWKRREFFPYTFIPSKDKDGNVMRDEEGKIIGKYEGGYTPDKTIYKKNKKGQTLYDMKGNPIPEDPGLLKKGIEKIKKLINPFSDLQAAETSQKPQAPPLPQTPMPNVAAAAMQKNPQTGLTRNEAALLSPSEQEIAKRT